MLLKKKLKVSDTFHVLCFVKNLVSIPLAGSSEDAEALWTLWTILVTQVMMSLNLTLSLSSGDGRVLDIRVAPTPRHLPAAPGAAPTGWGGQH